MSRSKRSHEGYLLVDHRAGAGIAQSEVEPGAIAVPGGAMLESATITCHHCQRIVVLNPNRSRSGGYCRKCDHYICDNCEATRVASGGACKPFKQVIDEALEAATRNQPVPNLIVPGDPRWH